MLSRVVPITAIILALIAACLGLSFAASGEGTRMTSSSETLYYVGGVPPVINASSSSLDFGTVQVGSSTTISVTVTNPRAGALAVGAVTSPEAPFSKSVDNCSVQTIAQSGTCSITIKFEPIAHGWFNSVFTIPSNAANEPLLPVNLTGFGAATPSILITPNPYDLGSIAVGKSANGSITVFNAGPSNLEMGALTNTGTPFSILSTTCVPGLSLPPSSSCLVTVSFAPTRTGTFYGSFIVYSDTGGISGTPAAVDLVGKGILPEGP